MTVEELIKAVNKQKKLKKDYDFSKHIKTKYMGYAQKEAFVKAIIKATSYENINGKETYIRNTNGMLFVFTLKLIESYTDIEINTAKAVEEYDMLMESGAMNALMVHIPEGEINILRGMLDMRRDDLEVNTRSLISFFETKTEALQIVLDVFLKNLEKPEVQAKIVELTK